MVFALQLHLFYQVFYLLVILTVNFILFIVITAFNLVKHSTLHLMLQMFLDK